MKINLFGIIICLILFSCNDTDDPTRSSSRLFKNITENESEYIVEIFVLRNEINESCETVSNESFTSFQYGNQFYEYFSEINGTIVSHSHNPTENETFITQIPLITIGNLDFEFIDTQSNTYKVLDEGLAIYNGDILTSYEMKLPITTESIANTMRLVGSSSRYMIYRKLILKKKFNDNTSLPPNLWISVNSGVGSVFENGEVVMKVAGEWWGKFNGKTWEEQSIDIHGNQIKMIPNICN